MWTTEEIRHFLDTNNAREITNRMNIYQQEITPSNSDFDLRVRSWPHFLLAFLLACPTKSHIKPEYGKKLLEFYLKNNHDVKRVIPFIKRPQSTDGLNSKDLTTLYQLYCGLEILIIYEHKELIDWLFTKYNFDLNFIQPYSYQYARGDERQVDTPWPLILRLLSKQNMVEFLLNPSYKVNINVDVSTDVNKGVTLLYFAATDINTSVSFLQMLIDRGADPYHPLTINHPEIGEIHTTLYEMLEISPKMRPQFEKLKQCIQNKKPVDGEGYSAGYSSGSGSNSPMSLGSANNSPNGSPPRPSGIARLPPPGSPMQRSDSASSGSAGGSPEKASSIKLSPKEKALELLIAAKHNVDVALFNAIKERDEDNDLAVQKVFVDSGLLKFTEIGDSSVLFAAVTYGQFELLKYIFSKYPTLDVHKTVKFNQNNLSYTLLHGAARSKHPNSFEIMRFLLDKKIDANVPDSGNTRPLHVITVAPNAYKKVEELISRGANPLLTNDQGYTPSSTIGLKCSCVSENPDADLLEQAIENATEQAELRQKAIQSNSTQSTIITTPAEIQYKPASRPVAEERVSYGSSSAVMFQSVTKPAITLPPPVPRPLPKADSSSQTGTTMYVPLPPSSVQLPKQQERVVHQGTGEKKSTSIGSKLKKLFG